MAFYFTGCLLFLRSYEEEDDGGGKDGLNVGVDVIMMMMMILIRM